jgi:cardiolipin synthase
VRWLQLVFLEDWHYATGHAPTAAEYFPEVDETADRVVQILASGPDHDLEAIKKLYFAAIASAQERVLVTTPYFVPDEAMLEAIATAALRGVDVRVLVPLRSDSRLVSAAGRSYYDELVAAGVRIYEYTPSMIHSKTLVVDRVFAAVGTANMDNRSFRLNFEVAAIAYDERLATELAAAFDRDVEHARLVRRDRSAHASLPRRLGEAGARLLSPLL